MLFWHLIFRARVSWHLTILRELLVLCVRISLANWLTTYSGWFALFCGIFIPDGFWRFFFRLKKIENLIVTVITASVTRTLNLRFNILTIRKPTETNQLNGARKQDKKILFLCVSRNSMKWMLRWKPSTPEPCIDSVFFTIWIQARFGKTSQIKIICKNLTFYSRAILKINWLKNRSSES